MATQRTSTSSDAPWTDPAPENLGGGLYRIALPMPSDGLRAVNVYAIAESDGVTMIDAGWANADSEDALARALGTFGAGLADIRQFLITHAHRDHYSNAITIRSRLGTPVAIGRGEEGYLEALAATTGDDRRSYQAERLRQAGASVVAESIVGHVRHRESDLTFYGEAPDRWLDGGTEVELSARVLQVIATPGHTHGHVVFRDADNGLLFAGDHILPHITPSIGHEPMPVKWPLRDYLESLRLIRHLPDTRLLPAHGPITASTAFRVDELLEHHEVRLAACDALVRAGRSTAYEVALGLGWTRHQRDFAELDPFNQMLAVLETAAHLDVLVLRGDLAAVRGGEIDSYRGVDE